MKDLFNLKREYQELLGKLEVKSKKISYLRLFLFFLFLLFLGFNLTFSSLLWQFLAIFSLILFITFVVHHTKEEKEKEKVIQYIKIIERYEARKTDDWKKEEEELFQIEDSFLEDLNIVGKNSLFQFLNFTKTLGGKKRLQERLCLKKVSKKEILENQESITELKEKVPFLLTFQERLSTIKNVNTIDFKEYFYLLEESPKTKLLPLVFSSLLSCLSILTALLSLFQIISISVFALFLFLQLGISYVYKALHSEEFDRIEKCMRVFSRLRETYKVIEKEEFKAPKNQKLKHQIQKGIHTLENFKRVSSINAYRYNILTDFLGNIFFSLNFIVYYAYTKVLNTKKEDFKSSIEALEEMEVLISLTTICLVKENCCKPHIEENMKLEFKKIKHPLLIEEKCIPNDFACQKNIHIITGSNMSGKTSFMRTIGINLVLTYVGTYVNAETFMCPILKIFTSIGVKDDISRGISTFYGELLRIKEVLDFSKEENSPMILFVDEIFKGTNYNDRILGAKEVIKKLSKLPCMVLLTTHDFELCEQENIKICNYHFKENYRENKISFDYKLREGKCNTTNAKYLMRQMKIIDE